MNVRRTCDAASLHWVRKEVESALEDARTALERFLDEDQDPGRIEHCIEQLRQVRGTLVVIELYGAAMVAEELEAVAGMLSSTSGERLTQAAEALMRGLIALPDYLAQLTMGMPDVPVGLMSLLNDLRAVRDAPLFTETSLFAPGLDRILDAGEGAVGVPSEQLAEVVRRMRTLFHQALVRWYRAGENDQASVLADLHEVITNIRQAAGTGRVIRLFEAAAAVVDGARQGAIPSSVSIKLLVGRLDRVLQRILRQGEQGLYDEFPVEMVKSYLYYIASAGDEVDSIKELVDRYHLVKPEAGEDDVFKGLALIGPSADTYEAVDSILSEELTAVKDELDLTLHAALKDPVALQRLVPRIYKIADVLGIIGMGSLGHRLKAQSGALDRSLSEGRSPEEEGLIALASDLIFAELSLKSKSPFTSRSLPGDEDAGDISMAEEQLEPYRGEVMQELTKEFASVKDEVSALLADNAEQGLAQEISRHLHMAAGAMRLLELERVASLTERLERYFRILDEATADGAPLHLAQPQRVADGLAGIEYAIEMTTLCGQNSDSILDFAEHAITAIEEQAEIPQLTESPVDQPVEVSVTAEAVAEERPAPPPLVAAAPMLPEADDEIRGIFLEEAREQHQAIETALAAWRSNPEDRESLGVVRRGFHTLKGSGRMVGAEVFGEFAWAIENLLNRVIDGTLPPSPAVVGCVTDGTQAVARLVEQETGGGAQHDSIIAELEARAFELAGAEIPDRVKALLQVAETEIAELSVSEPEAEAAFEPAEAFLSTGSADAEGTLSEPLLEEDAETLISPETSSEEPLTESVEFHEGDWVSEPMTAEAVSAIPEGEATEIGEPCIEETAEAAPDIESTDALAESGSEASVGLQTADGAEPESSEAEEPVAGFVSEIAQTDEALDTQYSAEPLSLTADDSIESEIGEPEGEAPAPTVLESADEAMSVGESAQEVSEEAVLPDAQAVDQVEAVPDAGDEEPAVAEEVVEEPLPEIHEERVDSALQLDEFEPETVEPSEPEEVEAGLDVAEHAQHSGDEITSTEEIEAASEAFEAETATPEWSAAEVGSAAGSETPKEEVPEPEVFAEHLVFTGEAGVESGLRFDIDTVLADIFRTETQSHLIEIGLILKRVIQGGEQIEVSADLLRAFHTLNGSAHMAGIEPIAKLSRAAERLLRDMQTLGAPLDAVIAALLKNASTEIGVLLQSVNGPAVESQWSQIRSEIQVLQRALGEKPSTEQVEPEVGDAAASTADPELAAIFVEEMRELFDQMESAFSNWAQGDDGAIADLQRVLHTLKGAARLAGVTQIGDLSHALETMLSNMPRDIDESTRGRYLDLGRQACDRLMEQGEDVAEHRAIPAFRGLIAQLESPEADFSEPPPDATEEAEPTPWQPPVHELPAAATSERKSRPQGERIRISTQLLDRVVDNIGEVSIYAARLAQQQTSFQFNVLEMEQTVVRLREQLRKLEMETEAQILYRYEREGGKDVGDPDFDPLELDRFSTIQELSRALAETVDDLANIREYLQNSARDADTLLLQQSRVVTDLQNQLMTTRLVPFVQQVSRLERLVRQTAAESGKKVRLNVEGRGTQLDRGVLDQTVPLLEHLLRNAISHGIELPDERTSKGKTEEGTITLTVARDGMDVVMSVEDDGSGLDTDAIRLKAVEQGKLRSDQRLDDEDLLRMVLLPGFSTAKEVTQISGRGVGLDVVNNETKQLGGSLELASTAGKGSSFTLRLPFTLAITDVLLVQMGTDIFAIPHTSVENVVRIPRNDLAYYLSDPQSGFEYAGKRYPVRYFGSLFGEAVPPLPEQARWSPALLIRSGGHRMAVQVDAILGNRQIVVKSVGPQLNVVPWLMGGTILGDGKVALIVDVASLVRVAAAQAESEQRPPVAEQPSQKKITVMIVDDSITVRKVTARLLERHNMNVIAAKDGVEAVGLLQEIHPDVMLLDIEMPRMDGFELARHVRHNVETRRLPIIMITSRTGEKHRERAAQIGVEAYLGKPYQEEQLMEAIYDVLARVAE